MDKAQNVRPGEELDWIKLEEYLRGVVPRKKGEFGVAQFHGGHANLTYLIKFGVYEYVLRRPPFGKIAPGAHDMKREYKVLSKLNKYFRAAPKAYHYCDDESIIGAPFVVMERRSGIVIRKNIPEEFRSLKKIEERLSEALVKCLANLHKVDIFKAGLEDLGNPIGYAERQIQGWYKRWELCQTETNPDMKRVYDLLQADTPAPQSVAIIHNDFKLDNCQFQPDNPDEVTSVFDWDMATLGDPLFDFASMLSYWPDDRLKVSKNLPVVMRGDYPPKKFLIKKYGEFSGLSMERFNWYESFAYFKGAVIAQQLYKRFRDGQTTDGRMAAFGHFAKILAQAARQIAEGK